MKTPAMMLVAGLALAAPARATLIASDLFDAPGYQLGGTIYPDSNQDIGYGVGVGINDGAGFATGWSNPYYTAVRTVDPGLAYPGLARGGFAAVSPAYVGCTFCVNSTAVRAFADNTAVSDLWIGFLIKDVSATDFATYANYGGIAVEDAGGDFVYVGVPGLQAAPTADYALQTGAGAAEGSTPAALGHTAFLVADIGDDGMAYLYVDPAPGGALGAPSATIAAPFLPSQASLLYWSDSWGWAYGDIRVGTTFADVAPQPAPGPEPQAWALALVGLAGVGVALRRRSGIVARD